MCSEDTKCCGVLLSIHAGQADVDEHADSRSERPCNSDQIWREMRLKGLRTTAGWLVFGDHSVASYPEQGGFSDD